MSQTFSQFVFANAGVLLVDGKGNRFTTLQITEAVGVVPASRNLVTTAGLLAVPEEIDLGEFKHGDMVTLKDETAVTGDISAAARVTPQRKGNTPTLHRDTSRAYSE